MLPWSSIFSEEVSSTIYTIQSWISNIFFFLFLITIAPWLILLAYDVLLYLFRTITYEIPYIGGRARGKDRPRAPSLRERPSGDPRVIGIGVPGATYVEDEDINNERRHDEEENSSGDSNRIGISQSGSQSLGDGGHRERTSGVDGANEKVGWTEAANARRRAGFKDNDVPG